MFATAGKAVAHAREGQGPVLIEYETYRYSGHFIGDPARYRSAEEVESFRSRDCVLRCAEYLQAQHGVSSKQLDDIGAEAEHRLDEAVSFAERSPAPDLAEIVTDVYSSVRR